VGKYSQINPSGPHKIWLNSLKMKDDPDICCFMTSLLSGTVLLKKRIHSVIRK